jgi:hypothetical protein
MKQLLMKQFSSRQGFALCLLMQMLPLALFGQGGLERCTLRTKVPPAPAQHSFTIAPAAGFALDSTRACVRGFIQNNGQWGASSLGTPRFLARMSNADVWVTDGGMVYDFYRVQRDNAQPPRRLRPLSLVAENKQHKQYEPHEQSAMSITGHVVSMRFVEARTSDEHNSTEIPPSLAAQPTLTPRSLLATQHHYLLGNDSTQWQRNVPLWQEVNLRMDVPAGFTTRIYIDSTSHSQPSVRYDLIIAPHTDPRSIAIAFDGLPAQQMRITQGGELVLHTSIGEVVQGKLFAYQINHSDTIQIPCRFAMREVSAANNTIFALNNTLGNTVQFALGKYNPALPLVIDPLVYSTYLGGSATDRINAVAVDGAGAVYVTGGTQSPNFPTTSGAYSRTAAGSADNIFVSKFSPNGASLLYSTYIGGNQSDVANAIAVDNAGAVLVAGYSLSPDYPVTSGVVQPRKNAGRDAIITKLTPSGNALQYSTFLGGAGAEQVQKLVMSASGAVTIVGGTSSADFPTTAQAVQAKAGGGFDAFATRLNPTGSALEYSTYLGGTASDEAFALAVDARGAAYIGGFTNGANFPTTAGAYSRSYAGNGDAFVAKLNPAGSALVYSTFLGGSVDETCYALAVDSTGAAYCTGFTGSMNFPLSTDAPQRLFGGSFAAGDAFVAKLNPAGSALVYSTFLGGLVNDYGYAIAVDGTGAAIVAGTTESLNFPTSAGAVQTTFGGGSTDAFVTQLDPAGTAFTYSTLLGGRAAEECFSLVLDGLQTATIAGFTQSDNFPTVGFSTNSPSASDSAYQTKQQGTQDGFISKLQLLASPPPFITGFAPALLTAGGSNVTLTIQGGNFTPQARVRFADSLVTVTRIEPTRIVVTLRSSVLASDGKKTVVVDNGNKLSTSASITVRPQPTRTLRAEPTTLDFGEVQVGTRSVAQRLTISTANLDSNLVLMPPLGIELARDSLSTTWIAAPNGLVVDVGEQSADGSAARQQAVFVRFAPPAVTASLGGFLDLLRLQNSGAETGVLLKAAALRVPTLRASTQILSFDSTDVSRESRASVTLTNISNRPTRITTAPLRGDTTDFRFETVTFQRLQEITLRPQDTLTLTFAFRPTRLGLRTATLSLSDDLPPAQSVSLPLGITLAGVGAQAAFALVPSSLAFPATYTTQRTLPVQTLTLRNDGNRAGRINAIRFSSTDLSLAPQSSSLSLPVDVEPGTSLAFAVQFKPGGTGTRTDSLFVDVETKVSREVVSLTARTRGEGRLFQPPMLIAPAQGTSLTTPLPLPQGATTTLRWEAVPSVAGAALQYEVQIVKNDTIFSAVQPVVTASTTLALPIEPETRYVWRVRASTQIPSGMGQEMLTSEWRDWSFFTTQAPVPRPSTASQVFLTGTPHDSLNFGAIPLQQIAWSRSLQLTALPTMQSVTLDWLRNDGNAFSVNASDRVRLESTAFSALAPQVIPVVFRPPNARPEPFQAVLRIRPKQGGVAAQETWVYCVGRGTAAATPLPSADITLTTVAPQTPAYPRDSVRLRITLKSASLLDSVQSLTLSLRVENSTMLAMDSLPVAQLTRGTGRILEVKRLAGDGRSVVVQMQRPPTMSANMLWGELTGIATLGTADSTRIVADEVRWLGASGAPLTRHVVTSPPVASTASVLATTLVVNACPADAVPRRIAYSQVVKLAPLAPQPAVNDVEVTYSLRDLAWTELVVVDMMGREVKTLVRGMAEPGVYVLKATTDDIPQGAYFLVLRTPFEIVQQRLHVMR